MGSGNKVTVYNTRERLVSTDHNREQSFDGADVAALLARTYLSRYEDDRGVSTLSEAIDSPSTALILDGLMLRPIDGSASALVDPGTVVLSDPDASPDADDVPWKWVHSDGIQSAGQLVLAANAAGVRIDVVEFRRSEEVVEYDNRDQFDTGTGLFSPTVLPKVKRGTLSFRIRQGLVGSSFPGVAAGWTPIAVVRLSGVVNDWDAATIWDVRPLLADRIAGGPRVEKETPRVTRQMVTSDLATIVASVGATVRVSGTVEGEVAGWRAGGVLARSVPGTMTDYLEATEIASQESSGVTFDADAHWYLYLVFPYGLPAWRRYSEPGVGGRVPVTHRGIAVFSKKVPWFTNRPSETIFPPNSTGLQNGAYAAAEHPTLCVATGRVGSTLPLGLLVDGTVSRVVADELTGLLAASVGASESRWDLTAGLHFPDNARAIHVRVAVTFTASAAARGAFIEALRVTNASGALVGGFALHQEIGSTFYLRVDNGDIVDAYFSARLVLEPKFDETAARAFKIYWSYAALPAGLAITVAHLAVIGWEIGD